jgi:hypothetical protein
MATQRTDSHRPSVINPENYEFVDCVYIGGNDLEATMCNLTARAHIKAVMDAVGGRWANHEHGGTCHVCGATASYLACFHDHVTNEFIYVGEDCAEKMERGQSSAFASLRRSIANAREAIAGKRKAKLLLEDAGLTAAWDLYVECCDGKHRDGKPGNPVSTIFEIVCNVVKYGYVSDKQVNFIKVLLDRHANADRIAAERAAEKARALPCPEGKQTVELKVIKVEERDSEYGRQWKMVGVHADGWCCWGTVPASCRGVDKGDMVRLTATFKRSDTDPKFGFFSRPRNAEIFV